MTSQATGSLSTSPPAVGLADQLFGGKIICQAKVVKPLRVSKLSSVPVPYFPVCHTEMMMFNEMFRATIQTLPLTSQAMQQRAIPGLVAWTNCIHNLWNKLIHSALNNFTPGSCEVLGPHQFNARQETSLTPQELSSGHADQPFQSPTLHAVLEALLGGAGTGTEQSGSGQRRVT